MMSILPILSLALVTIAHANIITKPTSTLGDHDLILGNCANVRIEDRVFYDHVYKNAIPLVVRTETEKYKGNKNIYCIQALNQKSVETGGNAYINKGGIGQSFVSIELESKRGHGLEFYVSIYAY